jgi:hypothetical protein
MCLVFNKLRRIGVVNGIVGKRREGAIMHDRGVCVACGARHLSALWELWTCWAQAQAQHRGAQQERLARKFRLFPRLWRP